MNLHHCLICCKNRHELLQGFGYKVTFMASLHLSCALTNIFFSTSTVSYFFWRFAFFEGRRISVSLVYFSWVFFPLFIHFPKACCLSVCIFARVRARPTSYQLSIHDCMRYLSIGDPLSPVPSFPSVSICGFVYLFIFYTVFNRWVYSPYLRRLIDFKVHRLLSPCSPGNYPQRHFKCPGILLWK